MSVSKVKYLIGISVYTMISVLLILLQSTGLMPLRIYTASAVLVVPLTVYAGFYFGEYCAAAFGFLVGAATDTYSSTLLYNTVFLTLLGFTAGLFMSRFFNRNIAAAAVVNASASAIYFFLKWLFIYAFSDPASIFVLTRFSLPSFLYTAILGGLMFFVLNPILKKIPLRPKNN